LSYQFSYELMITTENLLCVHIAFIPISAFLASLGESKHNWSANIFKIMLILDFHIYIYILSKSPYLRSFWNLVYYMVFWCANHEYDNKNWRKCHFQRSKRRKILFFNIISININVRKKFSNKSTHLVLIETQLLCPMHFYCRSDILQEKRYWIFWEYN